METVRYRLKQMLPESERSAPAGAKTDHTSGSPSPATHSHTQVEQSHTGFIQLKTKLQILQTEHLGQ